MIIIGMPPGEPDGNDDQGITDSDSSIGDDVHDGIAGLAPGNYWEVKQEAAIMSLQAVKEWMGDGLPTPVHEGNNVTIFRVGEHRLARQSIVRPGSPAESISLFLLHAWMQDHASAACIPKPAISSAVGAGRHEHSPRSCWHSIAHV